MPLFTAGIFLFSALAVVIPLALHLLHKRQPQPIKFAAVRFMRDAIAKSRRAGLPEDEQATAKEQTDQSGLVIASGLLGGESIVGVIMALAAVFM